MKDISICPRHILMAAGFVLLSGCISDPNYNLDSLKSINTDLNLFGEGIALPVGKTEAITLKDALAMAGTEGLDTLLKKDEKGNYSISANGDYNLDEVISEMHLEKLREVNGASFSKDVEYKIGDFDPTQFKIEGKSFSYTSEEFQGFYLDDIPVPAITAPDQVIKTELYKYLPENMDLGQQVGEIEHTESLLDISTISSKIPGTAPGDVEIPVQALLDKSSIAYNYQYQVNDNISFGDNASKIADVKNFKLKSGSLLKVELEVVNCPLTGGEIVPDLDLDMSSMLVLADAGALSHKLDLSSLVLKKENSWKSAKSYSISSLAASFPKYDSGKLSLKGLLDIAGNILIQNAVSTPNKIKSLADKTLQIKATVSLDGVVLDEMDITLASGVEYSVPDVQIPLSISYDLPTGMTSVDKVYLDQNKKLEISISATALGNLKSIDGTQHISLVPDIEIAFPTGLEIAEAVNGKVVISGEDLYSGNIVKKYTPVSIAPGTSNKKLSFNGTVTARIAAGVSGTFDSKFLPTSAANDVTVTAKIACTPALTDYDVTLDKNELRKEIEETKEFSFEIDGMADFGTFRINLKNSPKASLEFKIPATTEIDIVAENLVITIPSMMVVDGSGISGFDPVKNTITLNGKLPEKIELPIQYLKVTPQKDEGGKTIVKGSFSVKGVFTISDTKITRKTLDEINKKYMSVTTVIPSMEAQSISLEGDFSKSLDYEAKDVVFVDETAMSSIPKEVKSLSEVLLDGVNAIIEIKLSGMPDMEGKFLLKDTRIQLPSFLCGENDSNVLILDDEIEITNGKAVVQTALLTKLKDVQLAGATRITGDVKFISTLYSHKPSVDVSTLKSTVKATVKVGVGNGNQADHPGKIAISKAVVKVGYDIDQSTSLSLGKIPAELQGENVNLALNPQMHVQLKTNFGAPVEADFALTAFIGGQACESVLVKGIELPCSDDPSKTKVNKYAIGRNVTAASDETVIASDLSPLLKRVPDSIRVEIKGGIDQNKVCTIYPAAKYSCDMSYDFYVPLNFENGFSLSLTADADIEANIDDYLKMTDRFLLKGSYETTLPVGADAVVTLLDPNMHVIELKEAAKLELKPSEDGKRVKKDEFELVICVKDPASINLKKIRFNIKLKTTPNVNLREDQFIRISKLQAVLPEGINVSIPEE